MFWTIVSHVLAVVVGFVIGAFVFRNNPVKGEALAQKAEDLAKEAVDKAKDVIDR